MWKVKLIIALVLLIGAFALGRYTNFNDIDIFGGDTTVMLGPSSNLLKVSMIGSERYTALEVATYLNNVAIIIKSLPKNLPAQETLMLFDIRTVRWFDDYAKVEFVKDKRVSDLDRRGEVFRGQF